MGEAHQVKIRVRVIPNSKVEQITREGDGLLVRVKEPAKEGKANQAAIKSLARYFNVPQDAISVSSGFKSRNKVIEVWGR